MDKQELRLQISYAKELIEKPNLGEALALCFDSAVLGSGKTPQVAFRNKRYNDPNVDPVHIVLAGGENSVATRLARLALAALEAKAVSE